MPAYRDVFRVPGVRHLVGAMVLARLGGQMTGVVIVLFILERYRSPVVAGLFGLASLLPGTLVSPLAGALLDRYGRIRLVLVDYLVGALTSIAVAVMAALGFLPVWLLLVIAVLSSFTLPLAVSGSRSLLPLTLPRHLWDRGNAIDAITWEVASIVGPALAGLAVAAVGPLATLVAVGGTWIVAGLILLRVPEPEVRGAERHVLREAWDGLVYVLGRNPSLRALSILVPVANLGGGIALVAVPVLVLGPLHGGPSEVGLLWSCMGAGGVAGNVIGGRVPSAGRERLLMALGYGGSAAGLLAVALAPALWVAGLGMAAAGLLTGFGDISMFGLRQRATDPRWFGRAMSISMSLNGAGRPVGSGLAGPLIALSAPFALTVAAACWLASGGLAALLLRPDGVTAAAPAVLNLGVDDAG